MPAVCLAELCD